MNYRSWIMLGLGLGWLTGPVRAANEPAAKPAGAATEAAALEKAAAATASPELQMMMREAQTLQEGNKWDEAIQVYARVLKLDPTNDLAIFGIGTCHSQAGRYQEALAQLEKLLQKMPSHPMLLNNIAWIYIKATDPAIHNPEKALKLVRRAVIAVPSDYNIWNTLAEAYYAAGDYQRALRVTRQSLELARVAGETDWAAGRELLARCRKAIGIKTEGDAP